MKLEEDKKYLNDCGFILEDTETLDDEIEDLERQALKPGTDDVYKMNKKQANKFGKLWDRVRDSSVEKKVNNAVNFNILNFYKGLEERFDQYWDNWTKDELDYNFGLACQPVAYYFDEDNLIFDVQYFDEDGYILLNLEDQKKKTDKTKKIKLDKIDKNIEEVFTWFWEKVENYDQSNW